eukprot:5636670-Prymnesium_polylepis.1
MKTRTSDVVAPSIIGRHHVVALAGAAPRNAQLALLVWRGRRRASPLNRLSCPVQSRPAIKKSGESPTVRAS